MRVVVVAGICVEHDAISNAAIAQTEMLHTFPDVERVDLIAQYLGRPSSCSQHVITDPWSLVRNPVVAAADLIILHWGIGYDLFDAVPLLVEHAQVAVYFHNVTPAELVHHDARPQIERSVRQIQLLSEFDVAVWTYSEHNRRVLCDWGIDLQRIDFVPFPIAPPRSLVGHRRTDGVDLLTVGRLVPAKGVHVVVEALALLPRALRDRLTLRLAGNAMLSEQSYLTDLTTSIADAGLTDCVRLVGQPHDDELWQLFETSHVVVSPSFHEGLCVPIIEGYLAGCRAIGTTAGNLPFLVQPPDPVVVPGDPVALAAAIEMVVDDELSARATDRTNASIVVERYSVDVARRALEHAVRAEAVQWPEQRFAEVSPR